MKRIGFTGTRNRMSLAQCDDLISLLLREQDAGQVVFHHGDCTGADEQAHNIAFMLGCSIVIHPPSDPKSRAHCGDALIHAPKPYIIRNHNIVDETEYLVAAPYNPQHEETRSSTWATIRYAKKKGKNVVILGA